MKILIVINCIRGGGAERMTVNQANHWQSIGHEVKILTYHPAHESDYPLVKGVKHDVIGRVGIDNNIVKNILSSINRVLMVRKEAKKMEADIIFGAMAYSGVVSTMAGLGIKSKTISMEHSHPPGVIMNKLWIKLRKHLYKYCDTVVVLTERNAEWVRQNTNASNVQTIPNYVSYDIPTFPPRIDPDGVVPANVCLIMGAGGLSSFKSFDRLMYAFDKVCDKNKNWHLAILGQGELREELQLLRDSLSSRDRIHMVGLVGNMPDWYKRAEIFVLSSRLEGLPLVLMEAMCFGCAVLSTDCETGPREIIDNEKNGLLVDNSLEGLERGLDTLISNHAIRNKISSNAPISMQEYSFDKIMSQWDSLFDSLTNNNS